MLKKQIAIFLLLTLSFSFAQAQTFKEGIGISLDMGLVDSGRDEDEEITARIDGIAVVDTKIEAAPYLNPTVNLEYSYFPDKIIRIKPYIGMNLSVLSKLFFVGISSDLYIQPQTKLKSFYSSIGLNAQALVDMSAWHYVTLSVPLKLEYYIKPAAALAFVLEPYLRLFNESEKSRGKGVSARLMFSYYFGS